MRTKLLIDEKHIIMSNGVCLASNVHRGWYAVAYEEDGKIKTMWENKKRLKKIMPQNFMKFKSKLLLDDRIKRIIFFLIVLNLILASMIFFPIEFFSNLPYLAICFSVLNYVVAVLLMEPSEKRYHAALHMCLNSYLRTNGVKYTRSLKLYNRFFNNCKTGTFICVICFCILSPYCLYYFDLIGILMLIILLNMIKHLGLFNFFQRFTTLNPTQKELQVVLAASELLQKREDD